MDICDMVQCIPGKLFWVHGGIRYNVPVNVFDNNTHSVNSSNSHFPLSLLKYRTHLCCASLLCMSNKDE